MYAGHFAAGLAIKVAEPRAPMAAVMGLVFLPDLLWLGLSIAGVEIVEPGMWFDGWSHSIASIVVQAALVAALSWRRGIGVSAALGCAALTHLVLDPTDASRTTRMVSPRKRGIRQFPAWMGGKRWTIGEDQRLVGRGSIRNARRVDLLGGLASSGR